MKKLVSVLVLFLSLCMAFAEPKCAGITDSDAKNFAKNYSKIITGMAVTVNEEDVNALLKRCGISGPNWLEKYQAFAVGLQAIVAENEMDEESAATLKALGIDLMAEFLESIDVNDLNAMRKYSKQFISAIAATEDYQREQSDLEAEREIEERQRALEEQVEAMRQSYYEEERNKKKSKSGEGSKYLSQAKEKILNAKKTGDCGMLYEKYDPKLAELYKKFKNPEDGFVAYKPWYMPNGSQEALLSVNSHSIGFRYIDDDGAEVEDFLDLTVLSEEFYVIPVNGNKTHYWDDGASAEYVLKTKEAGTIHIWYDHYGNYEQKQNVHVWIEGLGELEFNELVYSAG